MAPHSQNHWPVLEQGSPLLHKWIIPATGRHLILRNGSAGFLLADLALWFHQRVERLDLGVWDDWGWAYRPIRDALVLSNHASGTAMDLNATRHPLGAAVLRTFTEEQATAIRRRLYRRYRDAIRWGGDYTQRVDAMHFELVQDLAFCERLARSLMDTPRGRQVLASNPGQRAVILS